MTINFNKLQASLAKKETQYAATLAACNLPTEDLETIVSRIEATCTDITARYNDWICIGFALANEMGEQGRRYFHRISRFYKNYSSEICDKQYNNCLRSKRGNRKKVTIKSFYYFAQLAGIDIKCTAKGGQLPSSKGLTDQSIPQDSFEEELEKSVDTELSTPIIPEELYEQLPEILRESCKLFEAGTDRDVFLVGSLAVLSGCLPNLRGIYFEEFSSPHIYVFITAPASAGKGKMKWAKFFGQGIHDQMVAQSQAEREAYERELEQYENMTRTNKQNTLKPQLPGRKMFYIPANISSSAFLQALSENNFRGVVFETEGDTLTNSFKQEWGNFSDALRKAFHHESTAMMRRTNKEYIEIKDPHLAMALSGTPGQVFSMMPTVEDGLFSRFAYYAFQDNSEFKHPFKSYCGVDVTDFFNKKAKEISDLYELLNGLEQPIEFKLTEEQGDEFAATFNTLLSRGKLLIGQDFNANIKRLGVITFRIAMLLSGLRILESGDISSQMVCSDTDYQTAINLAVILEKHALSVFQKMPKNTLNGKKLSFFDALPDQFDRQTYLKVADDLGIIEKTADKYISQFKKSLLNHEHNLYTKKSKSQADPPEGLPDDLPKE